MNRLILALAWLLSGCDVEADAEATNPPEPSENRWIDPVNGRNWAVSQVAVSWQDAFDACSDPYRLPDTSEIRLARTRGACSDKPCTFVWSTSVSRDEAMALDMVAGVTVIRKKTETAMVFCMEK